MSEYDSHEPRRALTVFRPDDENKAWDRLLELQKRDPVEGKRRLNNLPLFLTRHGLGRLLFLDMLYRKILDHHGIIIDLGGRLGANAATFLALRGVHEPFNHGRKILMLDTFTGFQDIDPKDGTGVTMDVGYAAPPPDHAAYLEDVFACHEALSPIAHMRKFEIRPGPYAETLPAYLKEHPETTVSLVYFDIDLYRPTRDCLVALLPYLSRGSILVFDELNRSDFPGETLAFDEVLGRGNYRLHRSPLTPDPCYIVYGEDGAR